MPSAFYLSTVGKVLSWARSNSLWYTTAGSSCCADEVLSAIGARYDLERFGCVKQLDPAQCDLLIVSGVVTQKAAPHLRELYEAMPKPRYVLAIGSCAACGGAFARGGEYTVKPGAGEVIPVDVYVPGCPPRPEAIMNGLIQLQERILGRHRATLSN
jgi:NADH-quinone oxidoreductase subunit B